MYFPCFLKKKYLIIDSIKENVDTSEIDLNHRKGRAVH